MNSNRIAVGTIVGALFMAIALAASHPFILENSAVESGPIGNTYSFATLGMIVIGIYGLITGGIEGIIISNLEQSFLVNILIGIFIHLFFGFVLLFLTGGGWTESMTNTYYASVIIGTINACVISLTSIFNSNSDAVSIFNSSSDT